MKNQYFLFFLLSLSFFSSFSAQGQKPAQLLAVVDIKKTTTQEQASKKTVQQQQVVKKHTNRLKRFFNRQKTKRTVLALSTIGLLAFFRKKKKWRRDVDEEGTLWVKIIIGTIIFGGIILAMPWALSLIGVSVSYWTGILIGVGFSLLIALSVFLDLN